LMAVSSFLRTLFRCSMTLVSPFIGGSCWVRCGVVGWRY
jgi:hypothetical protein